MNRILRLLATADVLLYSGIGLLAPIFAIFIERDITGGSIAVVGIAQAVYLFTKAIAQLFVARFTDRDVGYIREYWTTLAGYALLALASFAYLAVDSVPTLYAVQIILGIAGALEYPGWMVLFSRFTDHQHEGREWSWYSTFVIIGMALAASIGGWTAERYGFDIIFVAAGTLGLLGMVAFAFVGRDYDRLRHDGVQFERRPEIPETMA